MDLTYYLRISAAHYMVVQTKLDHCWTLSQELFFFNILFEKTNKLVYFFLEHIFLYQS